MLRFLPFLVLFFFFKIAENFLYEKKKKNDFGLHLKGNGGGESFAVTDMCGKCISLFDL